MNFKIAYLKLLKSTWDDDPQVKNKSSKLKRNKSKAIDYNKRLFIVESSIFSKKKTTTIKTVYISIVFLPVSFEINVIFML